MLQNDIISASEDLQQLANKYTIEINSGHLLVHNIPYVNAKKEICYGILVSKLELSGNVTQKPQDHVCFFQSEHHPCTSEGITITSIQHQSFDPPQVIFGEFSVRFSFSNKPQQGYNDYFHKMSNYINIIANEAHALNSTAIASKNPLGTTGTSKVESPFVYEDTNSSRAEIANVSDTFLNMKIAIIGLGGTGSYVLDFVAKTKVKEIHLFDDDTLQNHNAFRTPGAVPIHVLKNTPKKVSYFCEVYSKMKNGIYTYEHKIDATMMEEKIKKESKRFDFVFICIDQGTVKKGLIEILSQHSIPFIDVGIGVDKTDNTLFANARVTMGTQTKQDHFEKYISFDNGTEDIYAAPNIQIAEINAINAALAVIRWKKHAGFYATNKKVEYQSVYDSINNKILNSEIV